MKPHILLVDDDRDELSFFMDALRDVPSAEGFKCTYASSPEHALEMLKYLVPDYIFVDYKMPRMNGLQLLLSIKNLLGSEKPKVYLYSIFANETIAKAAKLLGAAGSIQKMYTIRALTDQLIAVLKSPVIPVHAFSGGD